MQESSHELILNQDKSRQSVRSVLPENLDLESDHMAWQKSNQMASGGTGEISMPQPKTQE